MIKRRFKKGDRAIHPVMGKGTITHGSYSTRYFVDWVCVKCDDWLDQKKSLCGVDSEWELLEENETVMLAVPRKKNLPRYKFHEMLNYCHKNNKDISDLTDDEKKLFLTDISIKELSK